MDSTTLTLTLPSARTRSLLTGLAIGALTAAVAGSAFGPRSALAVDPAAPNEHMISVYGTGRVVTTPDVADLRLGVSVTKPTVKEARALAADAMTKVIAALKKLGIADKDLQTTGLSLQPNYTYPPNGGTPRLTGYTLSNAVSVTLRDLDKLGDAIDDGLAAGATTLDGVWFRVENSAGAEKQAREQAMADAKAKAGTLASAAGVSINGVASISETSAPPPQPMFYEGARLQAVRDAGTPIQVGTNEVVVTVTVEYLFG
jgi:uncharacterized protein